MCHRVSPMQDSWYLETMKPQIFDRYINYFRENYEVLPLDILVGYIKQGNNSFLGKKAVMAITFDDGYKDNYLYAYPILKKYHIPATFFLATGHIGTSNLFWWDKVSYIIRHTKIDQLDLDKLGSYSLLTDFNRFQASSIIVDKLKKMPDEKKNILIEKLLKISGVEISPELGKGLILSWDEIVEMSNDGISFGAHTINHPILTNLPLEQIEKEIVQSKKDIEGKIGKEVKAFSYPNGDFNEEIVELIKKYDFTCAVAVSPGNLIDIEDSIYELNRIAIMDDFNKTKVILCGLWADLKRLFSGKSG
jgi:peptidoglycan/xylan/chitin deacetylase (PgdA/CDA1 family)